MLGCDVVALAVHTCISPSKGSDIDSHGDSLCHQMMAQDGGFFFNWNIYVTVTVTVSTASFVQCVNATLICELFGAPASLQFALSSAGLLDAAAVSSAELAGSNFEG